jgi:hypothetical protein
MFQNRKTPDVTMLPFAYSCIAYVCGLKRAGSRIARRGVGPASCRWFSLATAWERSEQGFPRVRLRPLPQVRGSYLKGG